MEKSAFSFDLNCPIGTEAKTIVLLGKSGIGKSATGNSIIGVGAHEMFDSMPSSGGVTATCQLHTSVLDDGQVLNVIDTPGFNTFVEHESMVKEIAKCINLAKNGIHAVLVVLSVTSSAFLDSQLVISSLKQFFGVKIVDYMIVVFSHGDALGEMSLENFLHARSCDEPLKIILETCGKRFVAFDNITVDEGKKTSQLKELLCLVGRVVYDNGGIPYTNELFVDPPDIIEYHGMKFNKAYEEQVKQFLEQIETKLGETALWIESKDKELQVAGKRGIREALLNVKEDCMYLERMLGDTVNLRNIQEGNEEEFNKIEERCKENRKNIKLVQEMFKELEKWKEDIQKKISCTIS